MVTARELRPVTVTVLVLEVAELPLLHPLASEDIITWTLLLPIGSEDVEKVELEPLSHLAPFTYHV